MGFKPKDVFKEPKRVKHLPYCIILFMHIPGTLNFAFVFTLHYQSGCEYLHLYVSKFIIYIYIYLHTYLTYD